MKLSSRSLLGLKRHFVGALSMPSRTWLDPASPPSVLVTTASSLAGTPENCIVDLGGVASPGTERCTLRITNRSLQAITITVTETPPWMTVHWPDPADAIALAPNGPPVPLELIAAHDVAQEERRNDFIALDVVDVLGNRTVEKIAVRMTARPAQAVGVYRFARYDAPRDHDFGTLDSDTPVHGELLAYTAHFENAGHLPLQVRFSNLPAWLAFSVDGQERRGPVVGPFFERNAPFDIRIAPITAPQSLGRQESGIRVHTNDVRKPFTAFELRFLARIEPSNRPDVDGGAPLLLSADAAPADADKHKFSLRPETAAAIVSVFIVLIAWLALLLQGRL